MNFIGFVVAIYEVGDADLQRWNDEQEEQLDRKKKNRQMLVSMNSYFGTFNLRFFLLQHLIMLVGHICTLCKTTLWCIWAQLLTSGYIILVSKSSCDSRRTCLYSILCVEIDFIVGFASWHLFHYCCIRRNNLPCVCLLKLRHFGCYAT
jgi:hypothetical protein